EMEIAEFVRDQYGLQILEVTFLPIGYELTVVYRVVAEDKSPYFLKLKRDMFEDSSVTVPRFLRDQGVRQIIAPVATKSHQLWAQFGDFTAILYPFVDGQNAFKALLTEGQWVELGAALKSIHTAVVPQELHNRLQHETYSPQARETVKMLQERVEKDTF